MEGIPPQRFGSYLAGIPVFIAFLLVPFLGGNHLPLGFKTIDRFLIEAIFGLFLVLAVLYAILKGAVPDRTARRFLFFVTPFFLCAALSVLYSWNPFTTLVNLNTLAWCLGCAYLALAPSNTRTIGHALAAGAFLLSVSAIVQHIYLFPGLALLFLKGGFADVLREQSSIPFGSYLYHNMLGGYLAFILPIPLYFAFFERKSAYVPVVAVIITGLILSSSRFAMALVLVEFLLAALTLIRRKSGKGLAMMAVAFVLAAAILVPILNTTGTKAKGAGVETVIAHKVRTVHRDLSTLNTRTEIWKNGVKAFAQRPAFGYGLGAFENGYRRYFDGGSYTRVAHSTVIKLAVELGIAGLLFFLFYLSGLFLSILREPPSRFRSAVFCALFAGLFFSMVDFSFDVPSHLITFFALSGLFFVFDTDGRTEPPRAPRTWAGLLSFTVLLVAVASFAFTAPLNLSRKSIENGSFFEENGLLKDAERTYGDAVEVMRFNPEARVRKLMVMVARYGQETEPKERDALKEKMRLYLQDVEALHARDSEVIFAMGTGYAAIGEKEKAKARFEEALKLYPSSGYYIFETARFYALSGDAENAQKVVDSFKPYIEKYRTPHNPRGIYVYKVRDLEATLKLQKGDAKGAHELARQNYADALSNEFVITSARSREYVPRDVALKYLKERQEYFQHEEYGRGQGS